MNLGVNLSACQSTVDTRSGLGRVATKEACDFTFFSKVDLWRSGPRTLLVENKNVSTSQVQSMSGAEAGNYKNNSKLVMFHYTAVTHPQVDLRPPPTTITRGDIISVGVLWVAIGTTRGWYSEIHRQSFNTKDTRDYDNKEAMGMQGRVWRVRAEEREGASTLYRFASGNICC